MRIRSLACRGAWGLRGFILVAAWMLTSAVYAAQVNLAWDPSPDAAVAGYTVVWGTQAGNYTGSADVGMTTQHTVTGLDNGKTYYFAVKAYNAGRTLESAASNEVEKVMRPIAGFSAAPTSGTAPLAVSFQNTTAGTVSQWSWDFGDGGSSSNKNPTHTYTTPGSYTVKLTATGPGGSHTATKNNLVSAGQGSIPPVSDFTISQASGLAPLEVDFSDSSTGDVESWSWSFGDSGVSGLQNPTHTYSVPGTYSVSLTVNGPAGSNTKTASGAITVAAVAPEAPEAIFTSSNTTGEAPLVATFTDSSQGEVTSREWSFGDGTTGGGAIAVHTYDKPGTYSVSLTVSGPGGSDSITKTGHVVVAAAPMDADFTSDLTEGGAPLKVSFTDLSKGDVDSWFWDFGDGETATAQYPTHTYQQPGTYTVTLTASGPSGGDSATKTGYVTVSGEDDGFLESGSVSISTTWKRVNFARPYNDPIVVAKPMNSAQSALAVIRIRRISKTGFEIRLQGWGRPEATLESLNADYLVMERGNHTLSNGKRIEAGRLETKNDTQFQTVRFGKAFATAPVVVSSVTSVRARAAVVVRQKRMRTRLFKVRLQEQQSHDQLHLAETVDYIAWERSTGTIGGLRFEVGRTRRKVTDQFYSIGFKAPFKSAPDFLADMQSQADSDPANLRCKNKSATGIKVRAAEETSQDEEVTHGREKVGYILIEKIVK